MVQGMQVTQQQDRCDTHSQEKERYEYNLVQSINKLYRGEF